MKVLQTNNFKKTYKKLHQNQLVIVDKAIQKIISNPLSGEQKKGDLDWLRVYKFKVRGQLTLLGYSFIQDKEIVLTLVSLGAHENFYKNIKNN